MSEIENDDIKPVSSAGESVVKEKNKRIDAKLIIIMAIVAIIIIGIVLSSGHRDKKERDNQTDFTIDKNAVQQALSANMQAYEQQQVFRHRQPATAVATPTIKQVDTNPINEMKPIVEQKPSNLPNDCLVAGVTNANQCKMFMARNSAPSTIFVANNAPSQVNNAVNSDGSTNATFVGSDANSRFANKEMSTDTVTAHAIAHPEFTVASGELVPAVLESAVNSDLPGMVRAVTSRPVYSYTGARVLIPAGSRLIGQYSSGVIQTQRRVFVIWNRVILPNGIAVDINSPSTNQLGISGQGANSYETHFWARFGEATLLSVLGAGVATAGVTTNDEYNSASEYRSTLSQNLQQSAQSALDNTIANAPTLHIFQGAKIDVFIAHDLSFYGIYNDENNGEMT